MLFLAACGARFSSEGIEEKAYVESFLSDMCDNYEDNQLLLGYVSPKEMDKLGVNPYTAKCNAYHPTRWELVSYDRKQGDVGVMIYGTSDAWQHLLTFRLVKESDRLYLVPLQYDFDYVDPWFAIEDNVGTKEKDFVEEFLQHMIDDYNDEALLLGYVSPAYCSQNGLKKKDYNCNAYSPESFTVGKYDPATGTVEAIIVGTDQNWGHRLTFKIVRENGRLYLWPGHHSDSYIDPWYSVETNVL